MFRLPSLYVSTTCPICLDGVQWSVNILQHDIALKVRPDKGSGIFGLHLKVDWGRMGGLTKTVTTTLTSGSISELIVRITQILFYIGHLRIRRHLSAVSSSLSVCPNFLFVLHKIHECMCRCLTFNTNCFYPCFANWHFMLHIKWRQFFTSMFPKSIATKRHNCK